MPGAFHRLCPGGLLAAAALSASGCATHSFEAARANYRLGRYDRAEAALAERGSPGDDRDRVLFLMERGMVRQAQGRHADSSRDWIEAADLIGALETYSVSRGAASLLVNDTVQAYRGVPFEWSLLHALTALNHFALAQWEEAAVEARRTIEVLEFAAREGFPADAFSAYVAGVALELIDDPSNAALMYRRAASAAPPGVWIDETTGRISPRVPGAPPPSLSAAGGHGGGELICFVLLGHRSEWSPDGSMRTLGRPGPARIRFGSATAGISYPLANSAELSTLTARRLAAIRAAKTAARIAVKEAVARAVDQNTNDSGLGFLVRLLLIGLLEQPDLRHWGTLPREFHVARVPWPVGAERFEVDLCTPGGHVIRTVAPAAASRRRSVRVAIVTDRAPAWAQGGRQ